MNAAGMMTRVLPDHETLAALFLSAKIEPWQTRLDEASLADCEKDVHPDDRWSGVLERNSCDARAHTASSSSLCFDAHADDH